MQAIGPDVAKQDRADAPLEVIVDALDTGLTITGLGLLMHLLAEANHESPSTSCRPAQGKAPPGYAKLSPSFRKPVSSASSLPAK